MDDWLTDLPDDSDLPESTKERPIRVMQRKADPAISRSRPSTDTYATADQAAARHRERQAEYNVARRRIFGAAPKVPLNHNSADDVGIRNKQNNGNVPESGRMRPKASFVNKNDATDPDYDRSRFVVKSPTWSENEDY